MKKTKIICTIGPGSEAEDKMLSLIDTGMNCVRMNFSHGGYDEQGFRIKMTRKINEETGSNIALLLDTKGPEIRTHTFRDASGKPDMKFEIKKGSTVRVAMTEVVGTPEKFSVTYPGLFDDMEIGGYVLVDDGYLSLKVVEKDEANRELVCIAQNSHMVKDKRGINIPKFKINVPFISPKDRADIEFAADQDLDFIAASFVRRPSDVQEIRDILASKGNKNIQIISKIENQEGVDNLDDIIEVSDGIMVARGDLGIEVDAWEVPSIQKEIIQKCQQQGKIVVVATQMLESMQSNPRPTRAEVNDVANAVLDGADATMLSGETTLGKYPIEAVWYMANINDRMQNDIDYDRLFDNALDGIYERDFNAALAMNASKMALEFGALAIVTVGDKQLAKEVSRFRPSAPIIAAVETRQAARSLALNFGIYPVCGDEQTAFDYIKKNFEIEEGDFVIVVEHNQMKVVEF